MSSDTFSKSYMTYIRYYFTVLSVLSNKLKMLIS